MSFALPFSAIFFILTLEDIYKLESKKNDQGYNAEICRGTGRETGTKMKIKQKHQKLTANDEVILWIHEKEKNPNGRENILLYTLLGDQKCTETEMNSCHSGTARLSGQQCVQGKASIHAAGISCLGEMLHQ